ncbi:serine/threonine protein kinase [Massilia arenosa]|uniref:Serine/threonine protein kinase n=1 Tax=Zemynaea arenosa TaxID=2561931 RepID=A0A4Y9SDH0_9BURK|nr:ATP-binding SpoIIE family protein phosphatase [Massilia arenosa]TFW20841.1 serine/threonine protein kinase [Massilia arenosa]
METVLGFARPQQRCEVHEVSQVAAARRAATDLATALGFDETATGEAALLVTEAATNILKHGSHGEILLRAVRRGGQDGLEIVALDHGPGISNLARSMEDGTSGAGTYGIGLGAMQRLSHEFDIYSAPGKGTVVHLLAWPGQAPPDQDVLQMGAVCLPMAGETVCGDAWSLACGPTRATVLVADGLGHGPDAARASEAAGEVLQRCAAHPPATIIDDAHAALRATRGAAVAVAQIDTHDEELRFAGIGNIAAHLYNGNGIERKQLVSHNGIVGSNVRKIQEFVVPWQPGALLILHSDGLATRWDLDAYPGLLSCHPALVAAVLYRDFCRRRDDVTVLVLRDRQA